MTEIEILTNTTAQRFEKLVQSFRSDPMVTPPDGKTESKRKKFGTSGLKIDGKIFAMLDSNSDFVVKLPKYRVDQLVSEGVGRRFDPRRDGHLMKEWLVISGTSKIDWSKLALESKEFVGGGNSKRDRSPSSKQN